MKSRHPGTIAWSATPIPDNRRRSPSLAPARRHSRPLELDLSVAHGNLSIRRPIRRPGPARPGLYIHELSIFRLWRWVVILLGATVPRSSLEVRW